MRYGRGGRTDGQGRARSGERPDEDGASDGGSDEEVGLYDGLGTDGRPDRRPDEGFP